MDGDVTRSFFEDLIVYVGRVRDFRSVDWQVYFAWVGLMLGLDVAVCGFLWMGAWHGVHYPAYVWNVPAGTLIFSIAIAFDTIGHRTVYREELAKAEALVHHITIVAGIAGVVFLCLAYSMPDLFRIPALCLVALSVFYSIIDEAMHWQRYVRGLSDRVEMWSHFFIFVGHTIQVASWWYWFDKGYPGVAETMRAMGY
jgi:hypothetical protein